MPADEHIVNPAAFAPAGAAGGERPAAALRAELEPGALEQEYENRLRPRRFADFIGQLRAVENLGVALSAARARNEPPDHVLLCGPPGLGKTSLARIVAAELGTQLHSASGPSIERAKDLIGVLTSLQHGDVLFIDEIHRIPAQVEEYLYSAMEDFSVDLALDQGPNARVLSFALKPFTLIGATTREGSLSAPFRARFGLLERLDPYPPEELERILARSSALLDVQLEPAAAQLVAARSRGTPRIANRFLRRVRDLAQVRGARSASAALASEALERLGVDRHGLEELDRRILRCLALAPGRALGLKTIAAAVGENEETIEEVYEPHLLRQGWIERTARGRVATEAGRRIAFEDGMPRGAAALFEGA
jgi:Holliday junction DNA helicase RuvB